MRLDLKLNNVAGVLFSCHTIIVQKDLEAHQIVISFICKKETEAFLSALISYMSTFELEDWATLVRRRAMISNRRRSKKANLARSPAPFSPLKMAFLMIRVATTCAP